MFWNSNEQFTHSFFTLLYRINTPQVLERVALLFKGKPWLIRNFLMFLPPGHISELSSSPESLIEITSPNGSKIEIDTNKGIVSFQQQQ